nr:MAG TPA: hypothetical protein [Caudoviricetes sp.]
MGIYLSPPSSYKCITKYDDTFVLHISQHFCVTIHSS